MVTKKESTGKEARKGGVKVAKLTLNQESVKDLTASQRKQIKGGKATALISIGPGCGYTDKPPCN